MEHEIAEVLREISGETKPAAHAEPQTVYEPKVGDHVKVLDGPFEDFHAIVDTVDSETKRAKVVLEFFGRLTAVELDFAHVEREVQV